MAGATSLTCGVCHGDTPPDGRFCVHCGTELIATCARCGRNLKAPHTRCEICAVSDQGGPAKPVTRATLSPYTPVYLAHDVLVSRAAIEGEHKQITVLFCDLVGSTALAERIGPEAMHQVLKQFFDIALGEVHRFEGTINQFLGDGLMALFGAPITHEDHALRAAHAALSLRRRFHDEQLRSSAEPDMLELRMGLNTGSVVVGGIGDSLRMDYTAIGDTTNLAARMQQLAAPGDILVAERTWKAIRHQFDGTALGERRIKGKAFKVPVFRLEAVASERSGSVEPSLASLTSVLVGRQHELRQLRERLQRLRDGEGGIVGVIGEVGVGKTRLLHESRRGAGEGLRWLEGHALSFGRNLSYGPVMGLLCGLADVSDRLSTEANWVQLEKFLTELLGDDAEDTLPFAGMVMGLKLPAVASGLVARLDPQDVRGNIFIAARRIFQALTKRCPVVLELEDWHWADDASSALIEHLLPLTAVAPLLIIFAGRPDDNGTCARLQFLAAQRHAHLYLEILLSRLSNSDSNLLLEGVLGMRDIPSRLRGLILRRAEGNPLFIEELIRALRGSAAVEWNPAQGVLEVVGDVYALELPDNVQAVIMARIDRLESELKEVIRLAAVIGRSFHRPILQVLNDAGHALDSCLDQLQQLELIRRRSRVPDIEYMFRHALVHEASYLSILTERRVELHRRVAAALESMFSDRLEEFASVLAYHHARGAEWDKAMNHLQRAGDHASQMAADVEAATCYQQAFEACARNLGERWDPVERASLERRLGEALFRIGRHEDALERLHNALRLIGQPRPTSPFGVRLAILGHCLRQAWHHLLHRRYERRDSATSARDVERLRCFVALGWIDFWRDDEEFFLDVLSGLNWAERSGIRPAVAQGMSGLAVACDVLGLAWLAARYHQRAVTAADALGDVVIRASAAFGRALHDAYIGAWSEATSGMRGAAGMFRAHGKLRERGVAEATLALLLIMRGDLREASSFIDELAGMADDAGDAQNAVFANLLRGVLNLHLGRLDLAHTQLLAGMEGAASVPDRQSLCQAHGYQALCALFAHDMPTAAQAVARGVALLEEKRIAPHNAEALHYARAWLAIEQYEQLRGDDRKAALRRARRAVRDLRALARIYRGALPLAQCAAGTLYWIDRDLPRAIACWTDAEAAAKALHSDLLTGIVMQERGVRLRERACLEAALAAFDGLDAPLHAARVLRQLGTMMAPLDPRAAALHLRRAQALHERMNLPAELALVEAALAALPVATER